MRQFRQSLTTLQQSDSKFLEHLRPGSAPHRLVRSLHGAVDIGGRSPRNSGPGLPAIGIDRIEPFAVGGVHILAVDEKLIGLHVLLPSRQGDDVRFVDVRSHGFVESTKPGRCRVSGSSRFVATKSPKGSIIILFDLNTVEHLGDSRRHLVRSPRLAPYPNAHTLGSHRAGSGQAALQS